MVSLTLSEQLMISISPRNINRLAEQINITNKQIISSIKSILNETLEMVKKDLQLWILRFVPKRTGQLQFTLLKQLESSKVRNGILIFIIGTHLDYAKRVNQMSTAQVQHSSHKEHGGGWAYAYYYTYKRRGIKVGKRKMGVGKRYRGISHYRIYLYDPEAVGGFWDKLLKYLKARVLIHLKNAMKAQYGDTKLPWVIR